MAGGRQPTETALLTAALARGDEADWREFEARYFSRLLRYLLVVTEGRWETAQDALQLTFLRVVRHVRVFDSEEVFWSWLTVVARNCVVDEHRKRARYFALLDRFFRRREMEADTAHDLDRHNSPPDLLALLEQSLATLPPEERGLLERKYYARQPVRTIAGETATTEKAIESRLVRIRRKLHDAIVAKLKHEESN
jgi:RNA polymerase sigma-70 factor (ECF subfamily)